MSILVWYTMTNIVCKVKDKFINNDFMCDVPFIIFVFDYVKIYHENE